MAYLKNEELRFLTDLYDKLVQCDFDENYIEHLGTIISRLDCSRKDVNARTARIIAEKRKADPTYGRSEAERERIKRNLEREHEATPNARAYVTCKGGY